MELKHELARCISSFREDLLQLLRQAIDDQVSAALEKARARREANERAARLREEKARRKREALTFKLKRRGADLFDSARPESSTRRRKKRSRSALLEDNGAAASAQADPPAPTPAPLFVHKRLRSGEIRELRRSQNGTPQP